MTEKTKLIESIVNENAVDFRQIVNKVLLEKLSVRLDSEYKNAASGLFRLSEAEEAGEEVTAAEDTEETEEQPEVSEETPKAKQTGGDKVKHSYGAY
jgi:hypothetical protein